VFKKGRHLKLEMTATPRGYPADCVEPASYCLQSQPKRERIATIFLRMLKGVVVFFPRIKFRRRSLRGLRDLTGFAEIRDLSHEFSQGVQAKIVDGAFVGLEAVVTKVLPAKQRIRVLMDFLGRKIEEVEHSSVLPQVVQPRAALAF
jgi:hypothetical protein